MRHICVVFNQSRLEALLFRVQKRKDQAQDHMLGLLDRGITLGWIFINQAVKLWCGKPKVKPREKR